MKRKSLVGLLAMGLLVVVPVLAACGVVTEANDDTWETPHVYTGGFENCFICHTGGQSAIPPADSEKVRHSEFPLEMCNRPECHPLTAEVAESLAALERAE